MTAEGLIQRYGLKPHPEGGWYREIHRSQASVGIPAGYPGERPALTVIHFLLSAGDCSAFHRVRSEEVWIHLAGAPLELLVLGQEPPLRVLDRAGSAGEPVAVVPPGGIQAARTLGDFTLVSCLVAPGFDFADFELLPPGDLLRSHPHQEPLIRRFTR